jgi:hypothetical protein
MAWYREVVWPSRAKYLLAEPGDSWTAIWRLGRLTWPLSLPWELVRHSSPDRTLHNKLH